MFEKRTENGKADLSWRKKNWLSSERHGKMEEVKKAGGTLRRMAGNAKILLYKKQQLWKLKIYTAFLQQKKIQTRIMNKTNIYPIHKKRNKNTIKTTVAANTKTINSERFFLETFEEPIVVPRIFPRGVLHMHAIQSPTYWH